MKNMEKSEIRRQMKQLRRELTDAEILKRSQVICESVLKMDEFKKAKELFVYMDCKGEVSTKPLIRKALSRGMKVAAPKVLSSDHEDCEMAYYYIRSLKDVALGYYNIPEPVTDRIADTEDALLIVPGVGFDRNCNRCGYGQGFYDRYLHAHPHHPTVALAFDFQIVDFIPANNTDIRPQILVTESAVYPAGEKEIDVK